MGGLMSAFTGDWETNPKVAEFVIAPINADGAIDEDLGGAKILQYWPESIEEQFSANWQERGIPGATLPLYQWISGGERTFSFTAVFSRDMNGEIGSEVEEDKYNVDIDAAIAWLRMLALNDYADLGDVKAAAVAPPILWLLPVGMHMGHNSATADLESTAQSAINLGSSWGKQTGVYCVLLDASVTRSNWFQNGTTRLATVSLNFAEVMQIGSGIYPYGRSGVLGMADKYGRKPSQ